MNIHNQTIDLGNGREITIETGKLAKQAHGSVVVRSGDTMLLATIVSSYEPMDVDFLPLTVDYREKYAAAGRFPGGFFKRESTSFRHRGARHALGRPGLAPHVPW